MMHHLNAKPRARSGECCAALLAVPCRRSCCWQAARHSNQAALGTGGAAGAAFRSSVDTPPKGWKGPVFKLNANYPKTKPNCDAPWLKRDVNFDDPNPTWEEWAPYIQDIVDYVKAGQDPNLPDATGWKTQVNGQTRWYHVPWMAYDGERGREFVHGLTNELSTALPSFRDDGRGSGKAILNDFPGDPANPPVYETWSVGMYNPCGAWSVGQVFPPSGAPATYSEGGKNYRAGHAVCGRHGGDQAAQHHGRCDDRALSEGFDRLAGQRAQAAGAARVCHLRAGGAHRASRAGRHCGRGRALADALGVQHAGLRRQPARRHGPGPAHAAGRAVWQRRAELPGRAPGAEQAAARDGAGAGEHTQSTTAAGSGWRAR